MTAGTTMPDCKPIQAIALIATLDTKGEEAAYVRDLIGDWDLEVILNRSTPEVNILMVSSSVLCLGVIQVSPSLSDTIPDSPESSAYKAVGTLRICDTPIN